MDEEMDEESIKTTDPNPEDMQGIISELSVKLEEDRKTSVEREVTIRSQRKRISDLKREKQFLKALNDSIDGDIKNKQKERSEISCFLSDSQVADLMNKERAKLWKQQRALEEQREEFRLALDSCCQDLDKRWMDIEHLESSSKELLTIIQELRTRNKDLEVHLANAVMFGGAQVDPPISKKEEPGQLPQSCVELSDVEEEQMAEEVVEEKEMEPSVDQTKSWWRRQVRKVVKGMGTFRLRLKRCLGLKTSKNTVARLIIVEPMNSTMTILMPPVSVGMPPVSV